MNLLFDFFLQVTLFGLELFYRGVFDLSKAGFGSVLDTADRGVDLFAGLRA